MDSVSVSAISTALPIVAIVAAFLNQTIIFPYSKVRAVPVDCGLNTVMIGFSNSGTKEAIVGGGSLHVATGQKDSDVDRDLIASGPAAIELLPGKSQLVSYDITHHKSLSVGSPAAMGSQKTCRYEMRIGFMEYRDAEQREQALSCPCPF